jgi:aspartate dehydrogenase
MARPRTLVGLIGLGAIGQGVVDLLDRHADQDIQILAVLVRDPSRPRPISGLEMVATLNELLERRPDVIVEAAGHNALRGYGPGVLKSGSDLVTVSVGALADPGVYDTLVAAAEAGGGRIEVASGAVGALDAIAAASLGGLTRVIHTTRKPAKALLGVEEADQLTEAKELFHGSAREGVLKFPESVNVAAAVSLAGIGLDRTEVRVLADPHLKRNQHEVMAEGAFGSLRFEIQNVPTEDNPRTGRIAAMSIAHRLLSRRAPIIIG